jgi:hypothetical protein
MLYLIFKNKEGKTKEVEWHVGDQQPLWDERLKIGEFEFFGFQADSNELFHLYNDFPWVMAFATNHQGQLKMVGDLAANIVVNL